MTKNAPEGQHLPSFVRRCRSWAWALVGALGVGALVWTIRSPQAPSSSPVVAPTPVALKLVPTDAAFDPAVMPFLWLEGSAQPHGLAGWLRLQRAGGGAQTLYLHLASLRLQDQPPPAAPVVPAAPARQPRTYGADDVRTLWQDRQRPSGWLDFGSSTQALTQRLKAAGRLPPHARAEYLTDRLYAEVTHPPGQAASWVLKTHEGRVLTPDHPVPEQVSPLFHEVFRACVSTPESVQPPWPGQVLQSRYERNQRCGLMGDDGRWLAPPEFSFMEWVGGGPHWAGDGPFVLLLRHDEPCMAALRSPVTVTCLGQPLSSLFQQGRLAFSQPGSGEHGLAGMRLGYLGLDGAWAIAPQFDEARGFVGRVAQVKLGSSPALIDPMGQAVTPLLPSHPEALRWLDMQVQGQRDGAGLINRAGQMVAPFLYAERLDGNRFRVCQGQHCSTQPLPPAEPREAEPLEVAVDTATLRRSAGWVAAAENGRWGYQDAQGRWVFAPDFEEADPFEHGVARVRRSGLWGLLLASGAWLHAPEFSFIGALIHGVAQARLPNEQVVLLHADGQRYPLLPGVTLVSPFDRYGMAVAENHDRQFGYLDRKGQLWAIAPTYKSAEPFDGDYARVVGTLAPTWRPAQWTEPPYLVLGLDVVAPGVLAVRARVAGEPRLGFMNTQGQWLVPTL